MPKLDDEITPEPVYRSRRQFMANAMTLLGGFAVAGMSGANATDTTRDTPTPEHDITHYNNYYEFSDSKDAIATLAQSLTTTPWQLRVEGEVERPLTISISEILSHFTQETRVYRLRCVEGWSMVIPWQGFPLAALLEQARPTTQAHYVEFSSLHRPSEMIGQRHPSLAWPYTEGLRMDEAMHPLTLIATGLYGKTLPKQNGAPLRLAVPWKYGFKSIKAITTIKLVREQPVTSWMRSAPSEYGFYANVNPAVPHPRWSQAREVRIGELRKRDTLPFNGYADEVASLYANLDLTHYF